MAAAKAMAVKIDCEDDDRFLAIVEKVVAVTDSKRTDLTRGSAMLQQDTTRQRLFS